MIRRAVLTVLCALLGAVLAVPPDAGAQAVRIILSGDPPAAEVLVRRVPILRLRGADAEARARAVVHRLLAALRAAPGQRAVVVLSHAAGADLVVNGRHIVTADETQAHANHTLPEALARVWAQRLAQALERTTASLIPSMLLLRPGQEASAALEVFPPDLMVVGDYDRGVADVRAEGEMLRVRGRAVGSTRVPIRAGTRTLVMHVVVRREAGAIPEQVTVTVTGSPPSAYVIQEAVYRRLDQAVAREPGATLAIGRIPLTDESLPVEWPLTLTVPVSVRSPYGLPQERMVQVLVERREVEPTDPAILLVSNRPEAVVANGVLFSEMVDPGRPARLLYHHQNATPHHSRILSVVLANRGAQPVSVLLITGLGGPSPDSFYVGYAATARFLQNLSAGRGYILEIPAQSGYAFTAHMMAPRQLVSGILQLQVLAGGALEATVHIRSPWLLERTVTSAVNQVAYPHPRGAFRNPTVTAARAADVSRPSVLIDLGVAAGLTDARTGERLVGDYGVVYRLDLTVSNRKAHEAAADLVATPAGGPARALFLIDGRPLGAYLPKPYEEYVLTTITIPPGETQALRILTMPTAGSYYPVRLSLRPRE